MATDRTMSAAEHFDPYLEWLGIQPHEHPADHYRLLGLERFESDPTVIANAADQRMLHVRSFQTGPRGIHTQDLLNTLAAAKVCLVNADAKARYDSQLASREPLAPPRVDSAPLPPPVWTAAADSAGEPEAPPVADTVAAAHEGPKGEEESRSFKKPIFFVAAVAAVAIVAVLVWAIGQSLSSSEGSTAGAESAEETPPSRPPNDRPPKDDIPPDGVVIHQEGSGAINFPASLARIKDSAEYDSRGDDGLITNIVSEEELLSWQFQVARRGAFKVLIEYSAVEASADGSFEIAIGDQKARFSVRESGGGFVTDEKTIFITRTGRNTLTLRPTTISGDELMTLRAIRLEPAG